MDRIERSPGPAQREDAQSSSHKSEPASSPTVGLSAVELASRIANGSVSSSQVVEDHIGRIEALNPNLNAMVFERFDQARAEARQADEARERGEKLGPLHGVPITIKEQFRVAGSPSTLGLPSRKQIEEVDEGPLVQSLRDAGAVILGKTNLSQMLILIEADNPAFGRTSNPWALDRSSGGSSGGEAALIAAGGSSLGLGGDLGGSIIIPAAFCGIHGLKPTSGRLTGADNPPGTFPAQEGIVPQPGPMARSVRDLVVAMQVFTGSGQESVDPSVAQVPMRDPNQVDIADLTIGVYDDDGHISASPSVRRATREAAEALSTMGATVVEFKPPDVSWALSLFLGLLSADGMVTFRRLISADPVDYRLKRLLRLAGIPGFLRPPLRLLLSALGQKRVAAALSNVRRRSVKEYWRLLGQRREYSARFLAAMDKQNLDVLLCPPFATPAFRHGSGADLLDGASYPQLFNLLGMPTGAVAVSRVREGEESDRVVSRDIVDKAARQTEENSVGLPLGVQVAARHWREDHVLAVMAAVEAHFRAQPDYPATPPLEEVSV